MQWILLYSGSPIYGLIVDLPDGIGTRPLVAWDGKEAFEIGRRLFNECRQAGAVRGEEEEVDDELL